MGKFTDTRNVGDKTVVKDSFSGTKYRNVAEIQQMFLSRNVNTKMSDSFDESSFDPCEEMNNNEGEPVKKRDKFKTIKVKLTDMFELLQRPKRKPLREFFMDEEEELESKFDPLISVIFALVLF